MRWRAPTQPPSPHFAWAEVLARSGYDRLPYGPTPIGRGRMVLTPRLNARRHAANLEKLRELVNRERHRHGLQPTGIHVLSWARSYRHNADVGGAADSRHLYFDATDLGREEIARLMPWASGAAEFDAILEGVFAHGGVGSYPGGNRHCDSRGYRARWPSF